MLAALEALRGEYDFDIREVDVDSDPVAEQKYNELVPVLTDPDGRELCHYYLDPQRVGEYLGQVRRDSEQKFG